MEIMLFIYLVFIRVFVCYSDSYSTFENALKDSDRLFLEWFQQNGGSVFHVAVQEFPLMGRGIITKKNVKDGDVVMHIPPSIIITRDFLAKSNSPIHNKLTRYIQTDDGIIAAFLLYERSKADRSYFNPYIRVLPDYIPNLSYFSLENINELQSDILQQSAVKSQKNIQAKFEELLKTCPLLWSTCSSLTIDDYKWAMSVVDSRGLRFKGKIHLVPLADMFNYAPHSNHRSSQSGDFFLNYHKLQPNGSITILADRDCEKGSQLFEDYGDNDDNIYLQYHGFNSYENPFRCVHFVTHPISSLTQPQQELAVALQFKSSPTQCITESLNFNIPMQIYLSMLSFSSSELNDCLKAAKNGQRLKLKWNVISKECGFDEIKFPASSSVDDNSNSTLAIIAVIKSWLSVNNPSFNSTIEEDETILQQLQSELEESKDISTRSQLLHRSLAVTYRINMKRLWLKIYSRFQVDSTFLSSTGTTIDKSSSEVTTSSNLTDTNSGNRLKAISTDNERESTIDENNSHITTSSNVTTNTTSTTTTTTATLHDNNSTASLESKLKLFQSWFETALHNSSSSSGSKNTPPNKLQIQQIPGFRLGTVATAEISAEEIYLSVPTHIIIDHDKAFADKIFHPLLHDLKERYRNSDQYQELLLYLLHLYFMQKQTSPYWPYLQLLPAIEEMDIPLLWSAEKRKDRISPSHLLQEVELYRARCERYFTFIRSIDIITKFFPENILTLNNYLWATAILDSRVIWWGGQRHLVPLLDMINCGEGPDTSRVHSTAMDAAGRYAVTRAGWEFHPGDQVFENYGQPNHIYYLYHGFSLPNNSYDCLLSDFSVSENEVADVDENTVKILEGLLRMPKRAFVQDSKGGGGGAMLCLKSPMTVTVQDTTLWVLLAIKLQKVSTLIKKKQLGKPFLEGYEYLSESLTSRWKIHTSTVSKYSTSNNGDDGTPSKDSEKNTPLKITQVPAAAAAAAGHPATRQFLTTELQLLSLLSAQCLVLLEDFKVTLDVRRIESLGDDNKKEQKIEL